MDVRSEIEQKNAANLKALRRELRLGDIAPEVNLHDEIGRPFTSGADYLAGRPLILLLTPGKPSEVAEAEIREFLEAEERFCDLGVNMALLSLETSIDALRAEKKRLAFPWPAISDPTGSVFALYGLVKNQDMPNPVALRTAVMTPLRRVSAIYDAPALSGHAQRTQEHIKRISEREEGLAPLHAPVLVIPGVFSHEECDDLVAYFERESHAVDISRNNPKHKEVDVKSPTFEYNRQDRIDLVIRHQQTNSTIEQRLFQRVVPMVKKALGFEIARREPFVIARYDGPREGIKIGHRDNVTAATAHRKFALSLNLNDDFEGGEIVFREFSPRGYRGAPGTAFVFSSSLLHEVLETTRGRRYVMISHFF